MGQETAPPKPATPPQEPPATTQPAPTQTQAPAPTPASARSGYDPSETPFSIEVFGFKANANPDLFGGKKSFDQSAQTFHDLGKTRFAVGGRLSFPVRSGNTLEVTGFQVRGRGSGIAPQTLTLFDGTFAKGDLISDSYAIRSLKVTFNYLSFPAPPGDRKIRFKTLYELQYSTFKARYSSKSEATEITAIGNKSLFLPTFGLGLSYLAAKNFHIEMRGSGFGFPHKSATWDAEATAVIRAGRVDVIVGGKGFYLKTSTNSEQYYRAMLLGPFAALRYSFR